MPKNIKLHVPLVPYTTLGVGGDAEYFVEVPSYTALRKAVLWAKKQGLPVTPLGGGSNVLVPDAGLRGLVIRSLLLDITYETRDAEVYVTVGAGVLLDALVEELVTKNLWGLENFSGIPGTVGAVPIQNVGAYGLEAKEIITAVTVYDMEEDCVRTLTNAECKFGYRDSLFKQSSGKKFFILDVTFLVTSTENPRLAYADLAVLQEQTTRPTLQDIRNTIIRIRANKFPDWQHVGTAGSFFKNPHITEERYRKLIEKYPDLPGYITESGMVKVPLGWILDRVCNLKGYTENGISLYEKQALVLVCERGVSATAIELFSQKIIDRIFEVTGILVEREVTTLI